MLNLTQVIPQVEAMAEQAAQATGATPPSAEQVAQELKTRSVGYSAFAGDPRAKVKSAKSPRYRRVLLDQDLIAELTKRQVARKRLVRVCQETLAFLERLPLLDGVVVEQEARRISILLKEALDTFLPAQAGNK